MCNCGGGRAKGSVKQTLVIEYANGTTVSTTSESTLILAEAHGAKIWNAQHVRVNAQGVPL